MNEVEPTMGIKKYIISLIGFSIACVIPNAESPSSTTKPTLHTESAYFCFQTDGCEFTQHARAHEGK